MVIKCCNYASANGLNDAPFVALDKHRKFILNASSHDDIDTPKFKNELKDCIDLFDSYFNKIKIRNVLEYGTKLYFEIVDNKSKAVFRFDIELRENFKLLKDSATQVLYLKAI